MTRMYTIIAIAACTTLIAGGSAFADQDAPTAANVVVAEDKPKAQEQLDPDAFLAEVVERYKRLAQYEDIADVVQITTRTGEEPVRVETRIASKIEDGELTVETSGTQVRDGVGLDLPIKTSPAMDAFVMKYNLWLSPHMTLAFKEDPMKDFRLGVDEGFTPTKAKSVTIDKKKMVHLELISGDGLSEDYTAKFDLYIDPDSLLVERIEGEQRLPDGADYYTSLDITPITAIDTPPVVQVDP